MSLVDLLKLVVQRDTRDAVADAIAALKRRPEWKANVLTLSETFDRSEESLARELLHFVLQAMAERGWPEARVGVFRFVAEELLGNAYRHGLVDARRGKVSLDFIVTRDDAIVECTDTGPGFSLDRELQAQGLPGFDEQRIRGLGQARLASRTLTQSGATLRAEVARDTHATRTELAAPFPTFTVQAGRIDGSNTDALREHLETFAQAVAREPSIEGAIVDLTGCAYISSVGLRALMLLRRTCREKPVALVVADGSAVAEVLATTRFHEIFLTYSSIADAERALSSAR